jgi:methyl-accepting chemotaxis protein
MKDALGNEIVLGNNYGYSTSSSGNAMVDSISESLKEQSIASDLIAQNVENLALMNESNLNEVKGVTEDSAKLNTLSIALKETASKFRT